MPPAAHDPDGWPPPPTAPAPAPVPHPAPTGLDGTDLAATEHSASADRAPGGHAASLLGSWSLVDYTRLLDGEVVGHPLGPDAVGRLEYRPDGRVGAMLMRRDRPWPAGLPFARATDAQRGAAALDFVAYAGRYTLREGLVLHHVEMSLYVEHVGDVLVRRISWAGPRLVLHTPDRPTRAGGVSRDRLEWARDTT
ncbi:lipocalin-like domain-containing protein [Streptomyces hirsutus]|uniref:lipocalin-like domain-containing protein n=1 Tax=Streptomyces hirsutus TaxID=35620 RepID=UPI0033BF3F15